MRKCSFHFFEYIDGVENIYDVSNQQEDLPNVVDLSQITPPPSSNPQLGNNTTTSSNEPTSDRVSRELGEKNKTLIVQQLISLSKDCALPNGTLKAKAIEWKVSRWTIGRIWKETKKGLTLGTVIDVKCKRKRVGPKPKVFDLESLRAIPMEKRTTIRPLAHALGIGHSTVYRLMKAGIIRSHTSSIKPKLSSEQMHKDWSLF